MRLRSLLLAIVAIASLIMIGGALSGWPRSIAAELPWLDPDWLQAHVGEGEGQIAPMVLQRARALQTGIADHVRAQDRGQLASAAWVGHCLLQKGNGGKFTLPVNREQRHGRYPLMAHSGRVTRADECLLLGQSGHGPPLTNLDL